MLTDLSNEQDAIIVPSSKKCEVSSRGKSLGEWWLWTRVTSYQQKGRQFGGRIRLSRAKILKAVKGKKMSGCDATAQLGIRFIAVQNLIQCKDGIARPREIT